MRHYIARTKAVFGVRLMIEGSTGPVALASDTTEPLWKLALRIQIESTALLSRRAQAYMDLAHVLNTCQTPQDFLTEHVKFWQIASRQYVQASEKMVGAVPLGFVGQAKIDGSPIKVIRAHDYLVVPEVAAVRERAMPTAPSVKPPANSAAAKLRKSA
jgi:hypothetical protein